MYDMSQVSYEKRQEMDRGGGGGGGGGFSAQFSGMFIFSIDSYYMDLSCCKRITKSFVM